MTAALRSAFALAAAFSVCLAAGGARAQNPPPHGVDSLASGRLVSVGSHRLYCQCLGSGAPEIVLLTGITETFRTWEAMLRELARTTRVCAYDRAGYGQSEPGPMPRTGARACGELQALLVVASAETPCVLLGHSLGALHAVMFAARFPARVAALVLVDPPPRDFLLGRRFTHLRTMAEEATGEWERTALASSRAGQESQAAFFRSIAAEHRAMFSDDAETLAEIESLGDLPLVVVASGRPNPAFGDSAAAFQDFWVESSRALASLSSRGRLVVAERSGHHVHLEEPDLLIQVVTGLVESLRDETRRGRE